MQKAFLVWNKEAGLRERSDAIVACVAQLQERYDIVELSVEDVLDTEHSERLIKKHQPQLLLAVGGDGTVGACARCAVQHSLRLAIIPAGTFNHFAKHVGIPLSPTDACFVVLNGKTKEVDTAQINGITFVNFVSIGWYASIIHKRAHHQQEGSKKWLGFLKALIAAFSWQPQMRVVFISDEQQKEKVTPLLFVGNNPFQFGSLDMLAARKTFDSGLIQLTVMDWRGRLFLMGTALLSLCIDVSNKVGLHSVLLREVTIETKQQIVKVVVDGELLRLKSPLHIASNPLSLRLVVRKEENDAK